jgi:hypothetical protein
VSLAIPEVAARDAGRPVVVRGLTATNYLLRFGLDPLAAVRRVYEDFGPFVIVHSPLKFFKFHPFRRQVLALAVGPAFNLEILNDPATWRPITITPGGPRNSASRRLSSQPAPAARHYG